MSIEIDGFLYEWGDRIVKYKPKGRAAPKTVAGKKSAAPRVEHLPSSGARAQLQRLVDKAPEVMVKVTTGRRDPATGKKNVVSKDMGAIKAHFDYISRNGEVALEDEQGNVIEGREGVMQLRDDWQYSGSHSIPASNGYKREAFSIVLSMPPGTDRPGVKAAARDFAKINFANHQWVFAQHDDEAHPHVHLCVRAVDRDLVRMNPRKNDLQHWRESFAEQLRSHGIEANATPRVIRGQTVKRDRQELIHLERRTRKASRVRSGRVVDARARASGKSGTEHPAEQRIAASRTRVGKELGKVAKALATSDRADDRTLALKVAGHVASLPSILTAQQQLVASIQSRAGEVTYEPPAKSRDPGKQRD